MYMWEQFTKATEKDVVWAAASILFVLFYFMWHLKSLILAGAATVLIALSFSLNAIVNRLIIGNMYYSTVHNLTIFIVCGIAADDVFVLVDGFRQTAYNEVIADGMKRRMAYSFRRAGRATLTTSATTAAAFLANAWNPMMPMASFGIYSATLVLVVYVLIIIFLPPIILWVETNNNNGTPQASCWPGGW